ncbi:hypothetical protein PTSG_01612 [Salpingoeca rosetta]|uniref:NF-X1-type domain-containing protein n=1 Tax=Salpingoeca rosetta (strain ATCC 50818 / BSB-021) TaxID=946362 RepID=F2TYG0_SALR5|nr:uncharacterized protein PTSG_01612 [Salpingoeca rosetta]EGD78634.1 hypothetical protein PTSG_01612 [Salpingoeca rosetta]|eukprot:XP_004997592.1 hypothetical protein PTSG_01612 [Salpingoeca rosetta]
MRGRGRGRVVWRGGGDGGGKGKGVVVVGPWKSTTSSTPATAATATGSSVGGAEEVAAWPHDDVEDADDVDEDNDDAEDDDGGEDSDAGGDDEDDGDDAVYRIDRGSQSAADDEEEDASCCIICLDDMQRTDPQWALNGVRQPSTLSDELFPDKPLIWLCPKCRQAYDKKETPTKYFCYCGKQQDPPADPWIAPHSCGEACGRALTPPCGHTCPLLCHPGACPPCPQVVPRATCFCGQTTMTKRCTDRHFSCGKPCNKLLNCGRHHCPNPCHKGECEPCTETRPLRCKCGGSVATVACWLNEWQCDRVCGKPLACGHHTCEVVCHDGECPTCPRGLQRTCPCGKEQHTLPCTQDVPTCGRTCGKPLACGKHTCPRACHQGDCGPCQIAVTKRCRCGGSSKVLPCSQTFTCQSRCGHTRSCGRHKCRKRCCGGRCDDCPETCGRKLNCGNHTCKSPCHPGACYPCTARKSVTCACGRTVIRVPCGRERKTAKPACSLQCTRRPYCRHEHQQPHTCHSGQCPPCTQTCSQPLKCGHTCHAPCHDKQPTLAEEKAARDARRKQQKRNKKLKKKQAKQGSKPAGGNTNTLDAHAPLLPPQPTPCPPCKEPVARACVGMHEIREMPCCENKAFACKQRCGRMMACGQHHCDRGCHLPLSAGATWCEVDASLRQAFGSDASAPAAADAAVYSTPELGLGRATTASGKGKGSNSSNSSNSNNTNSNNSSSSSNSNTTNNNNSNSNSNSSSDPALRGDAPMIGRGCGTCRKACPRTRPTDCTHTCPKGRCHAGACPPCMESIELTCHCNATRFRVVCSEWCAATPAERDQQRSCGGRCPKRMGCGHRCVSTCHSGPCSPTEECTKNVRLRCKCRGRKKELPCPEYQRLRALGRTDAEIAPCTPTTCEMDTEKSSAAAGVGGGGDPAEKRDKPKKEAAHQHKHVTRQQKKEDRAPHTAANTSKGSSSTAVASPPASSHVAGVIGGVAVALLALVIAYFWLA